MVLTDANQVWNRAALQEGRPSYRAGDRALADMLLAHSLAMNGGVHHSAEVLSRSEWDAAQAGYRYFGLDAVAALLATIRSQSDRGEITDEEEAHANEEYSRLIPDDESLTSRFEAIFATRRLEFARLGGKEAL